MQNRFRCVLDRINTDKEVIKRNYSINNCERTEQLPKNIYRQRKGEQK